MSQISGPITVSVEIAELDGSRRNVSFEVPLSDDDFRVAVEMRWRTSFEELAWQAYKQERGHENDHDLDNARD